MSQVVSDIVDIGLIIGGAVAAPFTGGLSLAATAYGLTDLIKTNEASSQAQAAQNQLSNNPVAPAGGQTNLSGGGTPAAEQNAPGATSGTATTPNALEVLNERADASNLAQIAYEEQGLSSIEGLKLQEQKAESGIIAGTASRGLKLEGSPLYQLNAQKEAGATAIGQAESQFALGDKAQRGQTLASYNAGLLNLSDTSLQIQTDLSNMWLGTFTNLINASSSFISKFWNPSQTMQNTSNNWNTNSAYDQSGPQYTPYMSEY